MAEDRAQLQRLLTELRSQLATSTSIDADTRRGLETTMADIDRAVSGKPSRGATAEPLAVRLGDAAADFEASHPTLAGTLGSIIDALARIGI